jgi:hypothetical protein
MEPMILQTLRLLSGNIWNLELSDSICYFICRTVLFSFMYVLLCVRIDNATSQCFSLCYTVLWFMSTQTG